MFCSKIIVPSICIEIVYCRDILIMLIKTFYQKINSVEGGWRGGGGRPGGGGPGVGWGGGCCFNK